MKIMFRIPGPAGAIAPTSLRYRALSGLPNTP